MNQPPEGFTTKAKVKNIVDGDTLDVEIVRRIRVRLKDCWCPETRTKDIVEKQKGLASRSHLATLLNNGEVVLFIPADYEGEIKDIFTFGRVVGHIFVDGQNVSEAMVESGHATARKADV